ncbi:MAG: hypothetical protein ABI333_09680 [bacterium]
MSQVRTTQTARKFVVNPGLISLPIIWAWLFFFVPGCDATGPPYICWPDYPVLPDDVYDAYSGRGEVTVTQTEIEYFSGQTYDLRFAIATLDEDANGAEYGVYEPRLYLKLGLEFGVMLPWCEKFVSDPPDALTLYLDGSVNHFRCFDDPSSDALLALSKARVTSGDISEGGLTFVGTYSQHSNAERYEVRIHSFTIVDPLLTCHD